MHVLAHGGAGSAPDDPESRATTLADATADGAACDRPIAAVVRTVGRLEAEPGFNAGVGSAVQSDGTVRTDAGLMTDDGTTGAACAMPGVEHAIEVARVVATETPHVLVAGEQAVSLAAAFDVETGCELWTPETRERWNGADPPEEAGTRERLAWVRDHFGGTDTVGAVATDGERLAAATSTGGRWFALAGRVGDVPQIGAGFYATGQAAASATGEGEAIARFGLARRAVGAVEDGDDPQTAADRVLRGFVAETGATAGLIIVDREGGKGEADNAERMQTARVQGQPGQ
jgi:beta-aspartyl-peptidase (threonine type)